MAETASSAVIAESENSAGSNNSVLRIVAPPKFVFGQNMSERIKPHPDDDGGSSSDDENSNSGGVKRSAEDEEKKDSDSEQEAGCLSPVKKVARLEGKEQEELSEEVKPLKLLFKPSMLSEVAKNLACSSTKVDRNSMTSPVPKTLGVSSSESTASEKSTDTSVRSHESAPGELGIIGPDSENYFQQFLTGKVPSAQPSSGAFVFGQNMGERVMFSQENDSEGERDTDKSEEKPAETIVTREHKLSSPVFAEKEPKTLAEVAQSCAVAQGPTSPTQEKPHKSLAEAAMAYQEHFSPPKTQPARVTVVTGEEEERNVLQSNCRLFVFDTVTHSWRERGRGVLRLNDMCQSMSEGIFQSRLVMRTQGSLRVVLNTKLWPKMTLEKGNERSLRITAMDSEKDIKIYLVMAAPNDIQRLWTAIDRRIQALKRGQDDLATQDGADHDHTPDDEEESKNEPDDKFEGPGAEDDDDSVKDRCEAPDESSNDSCPTGEDRGKETAPDADDD